MVAYAKVPQGEDFGELNPVLRSIAYSLLSRAPDGITGSLSERPRRLRPIHSANRWE